MEDFLLSIATKAAEYTVGPILHHVKYLCCFNNFVGNLPTVIKELELTRDNVKERTEEATNRTEKIVPKVEKWLKDVEEVLEEVKMIERRISEVSKSYFRRHCQYFLANEIAKLETKMIQLSHNSEFKPFSKMTELPHMGNNSSKDFVYFESTKSTYNKLLETLKDESVDMIGLVGMGGSGKTSLAKKVGKKIEELRLFEKVVMATFSQTPNIRSIQSQIANKLSDRFSFPEDSEEDRAQRLSKRLKKGTTLLILDDVWENVNFEALGIPFHENKGCRVLLTTRDRKVCDSMQCQSTIELNLLTDMDAWNLFTKHANINDDTPNSLKFVARKIVNECMGLPIAIVTVGSTLREKTLEEWKLALSRLEDSKSVDIPKGFTSPHVCLKLSYDNLTNQLAKSLLLLCSIFPEDHEIDLEDLFRFGKGWSLTRTNGTMKKARREMNAAIYMLKDSCLLLHVNDEKVKMHDMVRDVALWIASEGRGETILARKVMDPKMLVEDETIQDKRAISLWDLQNGQLPVDHLNCPTVEILLLHSTKVGFEVSNACLKRLKMLNILAFLTFDYEWKFEHWSYYINISLHNLSLPQSIELLKNIHTLCLRGYKLGDISILIRLASLEILDLRGSSFEELPSGIIALKKLKLLDLLYCWIMKDNAYEVIRRCLQLEELYLGLFEPKKKFPHNVILPRFQRYVIIQNSSQYLAPIVADNWEKYRLSRALCLEGFNASAESFMTLPIKDLFLRAEYLDLVNLEGDYKNVIPSMDPLGMNQLVVLILFNCPEIECVFESNMTNVETVFNSLTTLCLERLKNLQKVFNDPSSRCYLKNLRKLRIYDCPMLTSLFMSSIAQTLIMLEHLEIEKCSGLKNVIEEGYIDVVSSQSHISLIMFPKLRYLGIGRCDKLEYIFPVCIARRLQNLKYVEVKDNRKMKCIFDTEKEHQRYYEINVDINLLNLDSLILLGSPNLIGIWPDYCRPHLSNFTFLIVPEIEIDWDLQPDVTAKENVLVWVVATTSNQLSSLKVKDLELIGVGVKGVYELEIGEATTNTQFLPFNLDLSILNLRMLPELKFIWKGPADFLCLQMLRYIQVYECSKLTTIFSPAIVTSLSMLLELYISGCDRLEQIFDSQEFKTLYTCSQHVCFPQLEYITVQRCNKLKCLFYNFVTAHFPKLTALTIKDCFGLEKGFDFECEQIPLQNLKYIKLESLPKFKEIHCGFKLKGHAQWIIEDCPEYSSNL